MSSTDTCNGWKNRSTLALHLWLTNEEWLYNMMRRLASHRGHCGADVQAWVRNRWSDLPTLMRIDVGADLSGIDWDAIADAFKED